MDTVIKDDDTVTIYTKPNCPGCMGTKRSFDKADREYVEVDLTQHPEVVERFIAEGLLQAPVVEFQGERFAGFHPDRIQAIIRATSPRMAEPEVEVEPAELVGEREWTYEDHAALTNFLYSELSVGHESINDYAETDVWAMRVSQAGRFERVPNAQIERGMIYEFKGVNMETDFARWATANPQAVSEMGFLFAYNHNGVVGLVDPLREYGSEPYAAEKHWLPLKEAYEASLPSVSQSEDSNQVMRASQSSVSRAGHSASL